MGKKLRTPLPCEPPLPWDEIDERREPEITFKKATHPLWTENKAKLIERYLLYFVYITKHGTYIDGFSGPQETDKPEMWAAKLVLENEPRWLRHFYLYELDKSKIPLIEELASREPNKDKKGRKIDRTVTVEQGDCNELIVNLLNSGQIAQKEATFCLLDQRTFECKWSTVKSIADYKQEGENKIEQFYFMPNMWMDRALAGLSSNEYRAQEWWGENLSAQELLAMGQHKRKTRMCERFQKELGYRFATPWPIYEKEGGKGAVMYYMIHATDHPEAPKLMARAYNNAVLPKETAEQMCFDFGEEFYNLA